MAEVYDSHLVPLIFEPYATNLAQRLAGENPSSVLETAAGTGVLTRALANILPDSVAITATDLHQAMLDQAITVGTSRSVAWRQADALELPFDDETFDAVVCQFGVMFFPDKGRAFAEARRVVRLGGILLFAVWDRIEENEFAAIVSSTIEAEFPDDAPDFLRRIPHGYFDPRMLERDLLQGGFASPAQITTVSARSRASSPLVAATAYCQGTPLRNEIEARDAAGLPRVTRAAADAIGRRFGGGQVDGKIQAHIVSVIRQV